MTFVSRGASWLWGQVTTPPHMKPFMAAVYLLSLYTGCVTLVAPPSSIAGPIGPVLAAVWAWCFILGGAIGLAVVFTRAWWIEKLAIASCWLGIGIYLFVVFSLHFVSSGSRLTQTGVVMLAGLVFIPRFWTIRKYNYEPRPRG